jgi:hypothetical protein
MEWRITDNNWGGVDGDHDADDIARTFHRANTAAVGTDLSGMGRGNYRPEPTVQTPDDDQVQIEVDESHTSLQKKLTAHFNYLRGQRRVKWSSRNRILEPELEEEAHQK